MASPHGCRSGLARAWSSLLTARLGLLTIDLARPLPFHDLPRPALNDLVGMLLRPGAGKLGICDVPKRDKPEK